MSIGVTLKLGKLGLVNYIRRTKKEKSEVTIEERLEREEEVLVCNLQPTSIREGDKKNQSTCIEDRTPIPKENEVTNEEHMEMEEDTVIEIIKLAMLDQIQEGLSSFDFPLIEPSIASSPSPHLDKESNCGLGVFEMDVVYIWW